MEYDHGSKRLAYDISDNLEYLGLNTINGVDGSLSTWLIFKLVYSGGTLSFVEGPIMGVWDDRTTLGWT